MKKMTLIALLCAALISMVFASKLIWAQDEFTASDQGQSEQAQSANKFVFEPGDVLASENGSDWNVGKVMEQGGSGKDLEYKILFANGTEAWVSPKHLKKNIAMIKRQELTVGRAVFYTTQPSYDFHNESIRFTTFSQGKITSIGKLHRDVVTVNSDELKWKEQVIIAK